MSPRVAVVIRTKDRPAFLRRALASVTGQTFTDWECVIVNDGGDAATVAGVVAELTPVARERVSVIDFARSRGRWPSANGGVEATTAPLLVLHDDDDTWHPDFLERAVSYLDSHPDRVGVVSRIEIVWERREGDAFVDERSEIFQERSTAPSLSDTLLFNRFVPIGYVYRRSLHDRFGLYDETLPVVGDWDFNLRVLGAEELEYLPGRPAVQWRQRADAVGADGNSVISSDDQHRATDARIRDAALREYVGENGLGLVLYLTKFIDQRFVDVENGIRAEIREMEERIRRETADRSVVWRIARRVRARLRR